MYLLFSRICMKYIDEAMIRLKDKKNVDEADLSLVERILAKETDPKMACILALDLILVGIDTVRTNNIILVQPTLFNNFFIFRFPWQCARFSINWQLGPRNRRRCIKSSFEFFLIQMSHWRPSTWIKLSTRRHLFVKSLGLHLDNFNKLIKLVIQFQFDLSSNIVVLLQSLLYGDWQW